MTPEPDPLADLVEHLAHAPAVPGLHFRRWAGPDDIPAMHAVAAAAHAANGEDDDTTPEQMVHDYAHLTNCDPYRDTLLALVDDRLVAYGRCHWDDRGDGVRSYGSFGFVHPAWRRRGIGSAMLRWFELRNVAIGMGHATDRPRVLSAWSDEHDPGTAPMLRAAGYEPERRFVHMERPDLEAIDVAPMPPGLEIRPATLADARAMFDGDVEAFRDHWGSVDDSPEAYQRFIGRSNLDPGLWVMAWDGDACAGAIQLEIDRDPAAGGEPVLGWLGRVWVRRPWRNRGLARALVGRSLLVLRERGVHGAQLYVDVDNAQGAPGLYTRAGFVVESESLAWRKAWPVPVAVPDGEPTALTWRRR
jgi:ribosomal protein S18 acetylase RimI-like enzyme